MKACSVSGFYFPNCLFGFFGTIHFSFYLTPIFTPQVVGGGFPPSLVNDRVYPPSPPCISVSSFEDPLFSPLCRVGSLSSVSPLSSGLLFSLLSNGFCFLPSPQPGLRVSDSSEITPMRKKKFNTVRQCAGVVTFLFFKELRN